MLTAVVRRGGCRGGGGRFGDRMPVAKIAFAWTDQTAVDRALTGVHHLLAHALQHDHLALRQYHPRGEKMRGDVADHRKRRAIREDERGPG